MAIDDNNFAYAVVLEGKTHFFHVFLENLRFNRDRSPELPVMWADSERDNLQTNDASAFSRFLGKLSAIR